MKSPKIDLSVLNQITDRAFYLALQMIDIANHKRPVPDKGEPKVGGHPSACASSQHILAAIHLVHRKPEDYFAFKPHISPMDHALNFLMRNFWTPENDLLPEDKRKLAMRHLRHYDKNEPVFQSYHAESDPDSFRYFPSGSVGIPPVNALYSALGYQLAKDHGFELNEDPTFWCLMGDSEFREGSLAEAMPDGGDRQLKTLIWIVDYNRQNLDGTRVLNEEAFGGSDAERIIKIAEANGWKPMLLKHGKKRERFFKKNGGEELQRVLDEEFSDFEFQAVIEANSAALCKEVLFKKSAKLKKVMAGLTDEEIKELFFNVAGHDLESLIEAFAEAKSSKSKPVLIVAYTIKGYNLRCQGQSGNHSALPEEDELREMAKKLGTSFDDPFQDFDNSSSEGKFLTERHDSLVSEIGRIKKEVKARQDKWAEMNKKREWPTEFDITALKFNSVAHTQWMWGQIAAKLDRLGRGLAGDETGKMSATDKIWKDVASYFITMAPDVGTSTNTSPNMNGKLYGDIGQKDFEKIYKTKDEKAPDVVPNTKKTSGHLRFEIAEGNCMSAVGSFGKFFHFTGIPFFPAMTIYDFFIKRAHDQLYYNLYWHSSFVTLGTPSGITLAPEGAQHSWKSDFQMPNCVTWEPCFAKELEWIMADMLQRHFTLENKDREGVVIRCVTKGLIQKNFFDRLKVQKRFEGKPETEVMTEIRKDVLEGGYALIDYQGYQDYSPGDNVVHLFAMGALVAEAIKASDLLKEKGIYANVFVVTSPDLLLGNFAFHNDFAHLKNLGVHGNLYLRKESGNKEVENTGDFYSLRGSRVPVVSVHDGEPGLLDNIGSVVGTKQIAIATRKTSKSGTTEAVFHYHGMDGESIVAAAEKALQEVAQEEIRISKNLRRALESL